MTRINANNEQPETSHQLPGWRRRMPPGPGWLILFSMAPLVLVGMAVAMLFSWVAWLRELAQGQ